MSRVLPARYWGTEILGGQEITIRARRALAGKIEANDVILKALITKGELFFGRKMVESQAVAA